ncbi:MAG TPA: hypothetical protein VFW90_01235 [Candidatus Saccharimonadales bacterium]|nr:hypothetical protein [Candidatus Saccharimonadales bacterium]
MARKTTSIEGQTSIFDEGFTTTSPKGEAPITYGPEGSYVDVGTRATLLGGSLTALGKRNQRLGFDVASHTKPYSSPIWGRYEELTPTVIEGAQRNVYNFLDVAKRDFWAATGFTAMRGLGLISNAEIDARGRKMWRDFTHRYGDPKVRTQRDKYKRQLRKAIKNSSEKLAA